MTAVSWLSPPNCRLSTLTAVSWLMLLVLLGLRYNLGMGRIEDAISYHSPIVVCLSIATVTCLPRHCLALASLFWSSAVMSQYFLCLAIYKQSFYLSGFRHCDWVEQPCEKQLWARQWISSQMMWPVLIAALCSFRFLWLVRWRQQQ